MTILVVGASGATGRLLLEQLLDQGQTVRAIVRTPQSLPAHLVENERLQITQASLLEMTDSELDAQVSGCCAIASCLGHNLTFKGLFGHPRRLVTDSVKRLCRSVEIINPEKPVKFVLMNTTGNQNKQAGEKIPLSQNIVTFLLRHLLPPHADNEEAAAYLQLNHSAGDSRIEWTAVRPDGLIDEESTTPYELHQSPTRNPIFDAGKTSRINVAHFMMRLITSSDLWGKWSGQMPVIYNIDLVTK